MLAQFVLLQLPSRKMSPSTRRAPVPVTIITGYLGSGKTTLLNNILSSEHVKKVAVIVNEFGQVGIDGQLVIDAEEEIVEMNNGCICCTVRGDLIRIIGNLIERRNRFDHLVIETTGLADPAPVIQSFFVDEAMKNHAGRGSDGRGFEAYLAPLGE
jgi:G3E family GTPase